MQFNTIYHELNSRPCFFNNKHPYSNEVLFRDSILYDIKEQCTKQEGSSQGIDSWSSQQTPTISKEEKTCQTFQIFQFD